MIDCSSPSKTPNHSSPSLFTRVKIDLERCGLETAQNYCVRVMPETNSVRSLTLTNSPRNSLLYAHVHERIVPVLQIDEPPSLHQATNSPGFAASIALTKSSGATPRPCALVPRKKRSTRSFSSFSLNGTSSSIVSSFARLSSGIRKKSPEIFADSIRPPVSLNRTLSNFPPGALQSAESKVLSPLVIALFLSP